MVDKNFYHNLDMIMLSVEAVVVTFHVMMLYFLIQMKRRKNELFSSPFYSLTIYIFIVDVIYVVNMDLCAKVARFESMRFLYTEDKYLPTLIYFVSAYASCGEILGHTVIALNRCYVFKDILKNKWIWSKQKTWAVLISLGISPFLIHGYRLFFWCKYTFSEDGMNTITYVDPAVGKFTHYLNLTIYMTNLIPQLVASVFTFIFYRKNVTQSGLHLTNRQQNEYKLFWHSLLMFTCFAARVMYQVFLLVANYTNNMELTANAQILFPIIGLMYSLIGSVFLMIVSTQVRHGFLRFYKITGPHFVNQSYVATSSVPYS